jgi:hypothetical protein
MFYPLALCIDNPCLARSVVVEITVPRWVCITRRCEYTHLESLHETWRSSPNRIKAGESLMFGTISRKRYHCGSAKLGADFIRCHRNVKVSNFLFEHASLLLKSPRKFLWQATKRALSEAAFKNYRDRVEYRKRPIERINA